MNNLAGYLMQNPEFNMFKLSSNSITYNGHTIDMTDFDINNFLNKSNRFLEKISTMPAYDVFKIIEIHVRFEQMKKLANSEAKKATNNIIEATPSLQNIQMFTNKNIYNEEMGFLRYKAKDGSNRILANVSYSDFIDAYNYLQNNNMEINEENIYNLLATNHENVLLEDLADAQNRVGVSPEHLNNLKSLKEINEIKMEGRKPIIGNEKYGIYINNDKVVTMHYNAKGEKIVENHNQKETPNNEKEDMITKSSKEPLISFNEYKNMILFKEDLNEVDKRKIRNFEGFLADVITYKEYLSEDVLEVYNQYQSLYEYLSVPNQDGMTPETVTVDGKDTLERFDYIEQLSQQRAATNKMEMGYSLSLKKKDGYVSAMLYALIIIVAGIAIGIIAVMAK